MAFSIEFSSRARENLKMFRKRDQQMVVDAIAVQLSHQPGQPTGNRKKLEDNPLAPWELRVGDFRVFYDIDTVEKMVIVVAIGRKTHNILNIGGEEIKP